MQVFLKKILQVDAASFDSVIVLKYMYSLVEQSLTQPC